MVRQSNHFLYKNQRESRIIGTSHESESGNTNAVFFLRFCYKRSKLYNNL